MRFLLTGVLIALAGGRMEGQPAFEAASIKPVEVTAGDFSSGITTKPGRIEARNVTLRRCIRGAYNLPEAQVVGGPKWVDDQRYNIDAKANGPAGDEDLMLMLRTLLAERFQLKFHRETRQMNGYALVTAKSGFKMKPSGSDGDCSASANTGGPISKITSTNCVVRSLADKLAECLHLPVSDATGIEGKYSFVLQWSPDELRAKADSAAGQSLDEALLATLGLKLESRKVPTQILVIDSAVPASAN